MSIRNCRAKQTDTLFQDVLDTFCMTIFQVFNYIDSSYVGHLRNDSPQPSFVKIHDSDQKILVFPALSGEVVVGLLKYLKIIWLVVSTHLNNIKVSWDDYSQYMES